ncbi:MAG: hypothetical protein EOO92_17670, partial [Pedobacter sp.]
LEESASDLNEVIVVAYGTVRKESYTGSASVVNAKNFADRPNTSLQKSLQGAAAGVQVTSTSGQPGSATQVRVRGIGSLNANASPLYVVDGIATTSGDLTQVAQTADVLSALNPNDIESVTILKDAAATAIYGSRGANGVVLITTKQGRNGDTRFNASVTTGRSGQAVQKHDVLNAQEYYKLYFDSYYAQRIAAGLAPAAAATAANASVISRLTQAGAGGTRVNNPFNTITPFVAGGGLAPGATLLYDTDWRDEVLRTGITNDVNVSASGGSEKFKFYTSGGFFNQKGIVIGSDFNPVGLNELDEYFTQTTRLSAIPYVQAKFLNGFTAKAQLGFEYNGLRERQFYNPVHGNGVSVNGRGYRFSREDVTTTYVNTLTYDKSISNHNINVLVGQEAFRNKLDDVYAQATNFAFPGAEELVAASVPNTATSEFTEERFSSFFSRLNYNFNEKYYLSGSFRRDGASQFGSGNKYGNFWSVGGAWRISQEAFFSNVTLINELKLRASYGVTGNNGIGRYAAQGLYELGRNYEGQSGMVYFQLANPELQWEKAKTAEVGIEFSMLNRRLSGELSYYQRGSDGLLFEQPLSRLTGFNTITNNLASMDNNGVEILLNGTPIQTTDFTWNVSFNISSNSNKIKKLTQAEIVDPLDGTKMLRVGEDRYQWYLREYAGIDQADGRPMWYMDDATGNKITTKDYRLAKQYTGLGSALPDFTGGFNNTLSYKNFDLSAFTYFSLGGKSYDLLYAALSHSGISAGQQMSKDVLNA